MWRWAFLTAGCGALLSYWLGTEGLECLPGAAALMGIRRIETGQAPLPLPLRQGQGDQHGFPYRELDRVLAAHVDATGGVDYVGLGADSEALQALRRFVATLGAAGPSTRPDLFPSAEASLAWYINAYNSCVLLGVLECWPSVAAGGVLSVGGLATSLYPGIGFFYGLRFHLDGRCAPALLPAFSLWPIVCT